MRRLRGVRVPATVVVMALGAVRLAQAVPRTTTYYKLDSSWKRLTLRLHLLQITTVLQAVR